MKQMKFIFFDLDNTLYDSKQYFHNSFRQISSRLATNMSLNEREVFAKLKSTWEKRTSMYPSLFDEALSDYEIDVNQIVRWFNSCEVKLKPYDGVIECLEYFKSKKFKMGIVTDGNKSRQLRKLKALKLLPFFTHVVYTDDFKPKPSREPFYEIMSLFNCIGAESIYVGDNPLLDFPGSKSVGMTTVRIRQGEFSKLGDTNNIDYSFDSFKDFLNTVYA